MSVVKIIPRWAGHGDLTVVVDGARTFLRADDVERLAQVPAWSEGETVLGDEWPEELDGVPFYTLEAAIAKAMEHAGKEPARLFLAWVATDLPAYLAPDVLAQARRDVSPLMSYTVDSAARALATDPGVRVSRHNLFEHLERLGWVERVEGEWKPTETARASSLVSSRWEPHPDPARPKHSRYERVLVTPAGLDELRATLRTEAAALTPPLTPSLFD
ncbi:hypothetical protein [Microbacterium sp. KNMS]